MRLASRLGDERTRALAGAWQAMWTSRLAVWLVGIFAIVRIGPYGGIATPPELSPGGHFATLLVGPLSRWDSYWYMHIAATGYRPAPNAAFFPLYPALASLGGWFVGSALLAGVAISLGALLAALYLLWRLVELELGERYARPAVLVCAFFPMALFYSAVYAESLFLALTIGAFYCARRDRWMLAGLLGGLAAATRNTGVLLAPALLLLYLYGPGGRAGHRRRPLRHDVVWLALIPAGLGAFLLYVALVRGDALAPLHATATYWHRHFHLLRGVSQAVRGSWDALHQIAAAPTHPAIAVPIAGEFSDPGHLAAIQLTDLAFGAYAVAAATVVYRRLPLAYTFYCVPSLLLAFSAPVTFEPLASLPRYVAGIFPLQIGLAVWARDRQLTPIVVGLCAAGLAAFEAMFATWRWVA